MTDIDVNKVSNNASMLLATTLAMLSNPERYGTFLDVMLANIYASKRVLHAISTLGIINEEEIASIEEKLSEAAKQMDDPLAAKLKSFLEEGKDE